MEQFRPMTMDIFALLVGGLVCLVVGGEFLVRGASQLAAALGIPSVVIGLTVVAFGTSAPELAVSVKAALNNNADIAVANIVGSNIFNVLFILGISALISPLVIHSQMISREVPIMIGVSFLLYFFAGDLSISKGEGLILVLSIVAYMSWLVFEAQKKRKEDQELVRESEQEFGPLKKTPTPLILASLFVVGGLAVIMFGADWMVKGAVQFAQAMGVSDTIIGLTIVAAGTSLPEVVASIMATYKGERDIAVGNVVGSNVFNILGILGITTVIVPSGLIVNSELLNLDIPVMLGVAILCWPFFKTGTRLARREGLVFLVGYVAYTWYLINMSTAGGS